MNRTFEEIVNSPELIDGTEVNVRLGEGTFSGKIVGKGGDVLIPYYIVECLDGTLPNEVYPYKFVLMPLSEIFVK